jgi:hypothetical protein
METLAARILGATRKGFFRARPLFEPYRSVSESDLANLEQKLGVAFPPSLKSWLLRAGFGDINEQLSFRAEWFNRVDRGQLEGHVIFAQDDCGNFYAYSPDSGAIFFIRRSAHEYAQIATEFSEFLGAFEQHRFELQDWTDKLQVMPYDWTAV